VVLPTAEGCFYITSNKTGGRHSLCWTFEIGLHIDDKQVLEYIQSILQIGRINTSGKKVTLRVQRKEDIKKILNIFTTTSLQSIKQLNFQSWKLAYETYHSADSKDQALYEQIMSIKLRMNKKRDNYDWSGRKPKITPCWLLGFVEGDGSFSVSRSNPIALFIRFIIIQSDLDLVLLEAIQSFLNGLAEGPSGDIMSSPKTSALEEAAIPQPTGGSSTEAEEEVAQVTILPPSATERKEGRDFATLPQRGTDKRKGGENRRKVYHLRVSHRLFISKILIPFFDRLTFISNKGLDYNKWKVIFQLKEKGHHLHPEGLEVIEWLLSQMNSQRLSTNSKSATKFIQMSAQETKRLVGSAYKN
jgi:LAGLIDADG DNA endonuclease family protein